MAFVHGSQAFGRTSHAISYRSCCNLNQCRKTLLRASPSPDPDAGPTTMSLEEAEQTLQVKRGADFETVLRAKNREMSKAGRNAQKEQEVCSLLGSRGSYRLIEMCLHCSKRLIALTIIATSKIICRSFTKFLLGPPSYGAAIIRGVVERAYDVLLMQSMRERMSGDMQINPDIKYADVQPRRTFRQVQQTLISKLPGNVSTSLPPNSQLAWLVGSYTLLMFWAFVQGATEPYPAQQADVAGLQLALGFAGGVYFLRDKKRLGLGRSFVYATTGLIVGSIIGNLLEMWVRVDIVPLLGMGSPGVFVGEFGLLGLGLAVALLA